MQIIQNKRSNTCTVHITIMPRIWETKDSEKVSPALVMMKASSKQRNGIVGP